MFEFLVILSSKLENVFPRSHIKPFRGSLKWLMRDLVAIKAFHGLGVQLFNLKGGKPLSLLDVVDVEGT
jgi:hypothetical protein